MQTKQVTVLDAGSANNSLSGLIIPIVNKTNQTIAFTNVSFHSTTYTTMFSVFSTDSNEIIKTSEQYPNIKAHKKWREHSITTNNKSVSDRVHMSLELLDPLLIRPLATVQLCIWTNGSIYYSNPEPEADMTAAKYFECDDFELMTCFAFYMGGERDQDDYQSGLLTFNRELRHFNGEIQYRVVTHPMFTAGRKEFAKDILIIAQSM